MWCSAEGVRAKRRAQHVTDLWAPSHHSCSQALEQMVSLRVSMQHGAVNGADEIFLRMETRNENAKQKYPERVLHYRFLHGRNEVLLRM